MGDIEHVNFEFHSSSIVIKSLLALEYFTQPKWPLHAYTTPFSGVNPGLQPIDSGPWHSGSSRSSQHVACDYIFTTCWSRWVLMVDYGRKMFSKHTNGTPFAVIPISCIALSYSYLWLSMHRCFPYFCHLSILIPINVLLPGAFPAAFRPPHRGEPLHHWQSQAFRHWDACAAKAESVKVPVRVNMDFFEIEGSCTISSMNFQVDPCQSPAAARISNRMPQVGSTHKQPTQQSPLFFSRSGLCGAWHAEPKWAELGMVKQSLWRIVSPSYLSTAVCGP